MPLTAKGEKIKAAMAEEYGAKKGEQVFYASKNAGKITGVDGKDCDEMNEGSEGLKTYGDAHHHEFHGETGPEIKDKGSHDAKMGLVHAKEESVAAHANYPKPMDSGAADAKFTHKFPNDPFGDTNPQGGFEWEQVWSPSQMKNSPFSIYKE